MDNRNDMTHEKIRLNVRREEAVLLQSNQKSAHFKRYIYEDANTVSALKYYYLAHEQFGIALKRCLRPWKSPKDMFWFKDIVSRLAPVSSLATGCGKMYIENSIKTKFQDWASLYEC
ncbi:uncharacterized protein [Penaeus vannamei]|uniref:uncharacterized protein n=1 Tax=Penaeus vannamei TaxID=6689 RepID=UPI00387F9757